MIPAYVISAIADVVSQVETRASLDSLFMYADAPGDPPEGSKAVKALEWLRRINKESAEDAASIIGRIIEKYLDEDVDQSPTMWFSREQINKKKDNILKIRNALERAGLKYSQGGILSYWDSPATKTLFDLIKRRNIQAIDFEFNREAKNVESSPREAVSAACNILESVFKVYIQEHAHLSMPAKQDIQSVWKIVKTDLGLDTSKVEEQDLQTIVSGIMAVVNGIGALRTHASSAHGAGKNSYRLKPRHAKLAINSAHTIAAFVLETWDERNANNH